MRIAVIAANGRSGRTFVAAALEAGHHVRAGIRGKNPFWPHPHLTIVQCDATDERQVRELLRACDAVVSLLGHVRGSRGDVQTRATRTVVAAMHRRGIRRIVSLTGTGVRIKGDTPSVIDRIANFAIAHIDHARVADGIAHAKVLADSGLDFTILRVLKLTGGRGGRFKLTPHGPAKLFTSRNEVASAILSCLENNKYINAYPIIANK